eukprot:TRINITY_DN3453_c0_g1_i1.p1 TRINITY_DN3453_c0_g1~~TRINITY_DN3453_c0_g1_i1.p1  ORF type:complete len:253 (-),score=-0.46 TRINITY_DN3453_c0_g1_i1:211-969(-)
MLGVDSFRWNRDTTPLASPIVIVASWIFYFGSILLLRRLMATRESGFSLVLPAVAHNAFLCIGSLIMFLGIVYEMIRMYMANGVEGLYCDTQDPKGAIYFWLYIYYLSKFWELFDTWLLVLKKKSLIFLHVYHHAVVILMVWLWIDQSLIYTGLGMAFNTFIHVFMYFYFGASIVGYQPWWKKYLTGLQIFQFASSFLLSVPFVYYSDVGRSECRGWSTFVFSFFVNLSFLILFINFYSKSYSTRAPRDKKA